MSPAGTALYVVSSNEWFAHLSVVALIKVFSSCVIVLLVCIVSLGLVVLPVDIMATATTIPHKNCLPLA